MTFARGWPLFLSVVLVIVATSALLGWLLTRYKVLPGTTAVWGTSPGAASAMMVMSGAFGADARLVAFMQYLRVVCVAGAASVVARIWVGTTGASMPAIVWFPALPWGRFAATLLIAGVAGGIGIFFRIPAGALLLPMVAGGLLEAMGLVSIVLPPWLLAISYAFLGWSVGLAFTRAILVHASASSAAIPADDRQHDRPCAACWLLCLSHTAGIDPLTAYLATSPGGMDSIAIIAASSNVDLSFVMALQGARFIIVLITGPPLAALHRPACSTDNASIVPCFRTFNRPRPPSSK